MMEGISIKKQLVIEYDVISGNMSFKNEDDMTFAELLSVLEYTKWMIHKDWLENE
jgi:hypothetical protein